MTDSRISGLYKLSVSERISTLEHLGWLSTAAAHDLKNGRQVLSAVAADKMIENVLGVFGLPLAIAPNFIVNGRECLVPLVVEEPSIVAALSSTALLARESGGFSASCDESLLAGQIHLTGIDDIEVALKSLRAAAAQLVAAANAVHPQLNERGGGVREIEFRSLSLPGGTVFIAVHLLVDTCDAMGANLVNTICEAIAPQCAEISGGNVALRILSNLVDRSTFSARVRYGIDILATEDFSGEEVRDRIVLANDIALVDPHRAATHNKGIMNGVDGLAIATGNDWRAIEAGAHAYAARDGNYTAMTRWAADADGDLVGEIQIPLKVGIVGGTVESNPAVALALSLAGVDSAQQLAELMAAVGLAQNFAALRALATSGIQKGHMRLHARSVAASAGTPGDRIDEVVEKMLVSGDVKSWKAKALLAELEAGDTENEAPGASAAGKIILFGEHAVVYGRHALALPIIDAVQANVVASTQSTSISIKDWGLNAIVDRAGSTDIDAAINLILAELGIPDRNISIVIRSILPRGMGLGSSAAIAVAITRAVADCFGMTVDDERVNRIAFECEKIAHGTPSGIDNSISCFARPMLFSKTNTLNIELLSLLETPPIIIGFSHDMGLTRDQVAGVRARYERNPQTYGAIFDQIGDISVQGAKSLEAQDYEQLGSTMNICHGLLNAIEVSTPDLESMVTLARQSGAIGAKLTGAGGGGAMIALCPGSIGQVRAALHQAGYRTLEMLAPKESLT